MRNYPILFFVLFYYATYAQERFTDDIFKIKRPVTETYALKDGEELKLDIYQPQNDTARLRPLIVFMHGGGFAGGTRTNTAEVKFAEAAAKKGYVAVQISYRLTRKGLSFGCDYDASEKMETFQLAAEDFMDAVHFILEKEEKYRIDPSKVIVGGSSAGAEAVLNAVYNEQLMFGSNKEYDSIDVAGVFSLAGAVVDARYITENNVVPGVFFHGTEDNLVPYATAPHHFCKPEAPGYIMLDGSRTITDKLKEFNTSYMLYSFEGGRHEHSGMPFDYMEEIFKYFYQVFLKDEQLTIEVLK